ncbi:RNA polymerase sigma factor SigL [compost metagenome]
MIEPKNIQQELKQLYRKWPDVRKFLKTLGCDSLSAEDIFQEALLIYVRKRESSDFELTVEPFFYVRNTCKLLWYNQARKEQKNGTTELQMELPAQEDQWMEKEMKIREVESTLEKLGAQCQELLQLFYGLGWNMVDIAKKIGLRNDKVAKAQKYRCLQKAKELINENELQVEPIKF